jgi:hypothetical protein
LSFPLDHLKQVNCVHMYDIIELRAIYDNITLNC